VSVPVHRARLSVKISPSTGLDDANFRAVLQAMDCIFVIK
jgi:hypothetical protein